MTDFHIRLATLRDATAIASIYNDAIQNTTATFDTEPKTVADREAWLQSHDKRHPVFVAEVEEEVVGWSALTAWSDRPAYDQTAETSIYVTETFRGRGIGWALKTQVIVRAKELGYHTLIARMTVGGGASLHLNQKAGFQLIGTLKEVGFKFGKRLDVHIMQLMLDDFEVEMDQRR